MIYQRSVSGQRELCQHDCVGALLGTLADNEGGVVDPGPAANGERGGGEEGGHDGRVTAL